MQKKYSEFLHSADKFYNFQYFDTLAKHSPVNSKKCTAILSFLIKKKKKENRFQDCWKHHQLFRYTCDSIFSWNKCITCEFSSAVYRGATRYSAQRKKSDHVSLPGFCKTFLTREKYPFLHNHTFFMPSHFSSIYICEQLSKNEAHEELH